MLTVSVIIPLYNKALYIQKALDSVLQASLRIPQKDKCEVEVIVVNDGSTDNSVQVVSDFISLLPSGGSRREAFRLISQPNAGVSSARNRGIQEAKGDYLAFLDADDWWHPDFLKEILQLAKTYPDAGIWSSNYIYYKPGKTRIGVRNVYDEQSTIHNEEGWSGYINYPKTYYENNGGQVVWTGAVLLNRLKIEDCKLKNGDYFQRGIKLGEDFLLWMRLSLLFPVAFTNKPLAYYNNELPLQLRLTGTLHRPEQHMLWHLYDEGFKILDFRFKDDWKLLLDKLRVFGLMDYWMDKRYHDLAKVELTKVDWNQLPSAWHQQYTKPIWYLRFMRKFYKCGSFFKQLIFKCVHKK